MWSDLGYRNLEIQATIITGGFNIDTEGKKRIQE